MNGGLVISIENELGVRGFGTGPVPGAGASCGRTSSIHDYCVCVARWNMLTQWSVESLMLCVQHYTYKSMRAENTTLDAAVGQNKTSRV